MVNKTRNLFSAVMLISSISICSCSNNNGKESDKQSKDSTKQVKEVKKEPEIKYQRPPIVNIVDSVMPKAIVAYGSDSAATFNGVSTKLGNIYGVKVADYIKKNNLKMAGAPMAWYKNQKAPYFFDAGMPVNKAGSKSVAGVRIREISAGKAVIAHFYGPFELLPQGYEAVKEWMKDNKKKASGAPYEIYLTDPLDKDGKPIDPYKVQTDIIFPYK